MSGMSGMLLPSGELMFTTGAVKSTLDPPAAPVARAVSVGAEATSTVNSSGVPLNSVTASICVVDTDCSARPA